MLGSLLFRIIGNEANTTAWSFGITAFAMGGTNSKITQELSYQTSPGVFRTEQETIGTVSRFLVLPCITYIKKFGDISKVIKD
jgi:hypothetical protein